MRYLGLGIVSYNSSEKKAVELSKLFKKAKKSIRLIVPDIAADICFDKRVMDALTLAINHDVLVEIIYIPKSDSENLGPAILNRVKILKVENIKEGFVAVIDFKATVLQETRRGGIVPGGMIFKDDKDFAREWSEAFDELVRINSKKTSNEEKPICRCCR